MRCLADGFVARALTVTYAFACLHLAEQYLMPAQDLQTWLDGRASLSQTVHRCCKPKSLTLTRHEALCDSLRGRLALRNSLGGLDATHKLSAVHFSLQYGTTLQRGHSAASSSTQFLEQLLHFSVFGFVVVSMAVEGRSRRRSCASVTRSWGASRRELEYLIVHIYRSGPPHCGRCHMQRQALAACEVNAVFGTGWLWPLC